MIIGLQEPHEYHLSAVLHPVSYYMGVHLFRMDDGRIIYRLLWLVYGHGDSEHGLRRYQLRYRLLLMFDAKSTLQE